MVHWPFIFPTMLRSNFIQFLKKRVQHIKKNTWHKVCISVWLTSFIHNEVLTEEIKIHLTNFCSDWNKGKVAFGPKQHENRHGANWGHSRHITWEWMVSISLLFLLPQERPLHTVCLNYICSRYIIRLVCNLTEEKSCMFKICDMVRLVHIICWKQYLVTP
jgi:hypothetical protein